MVEKDPFWKKVAGWFESLAPIMLLLLTVYLYDSFISTVIPKEWKTAVFYAIFTYFVLELVVKYLAVQDLRYFIYKHWLDILLVIPFFKTVKLFGVIGKSLKSLKYIKYLPYVRKVMKMPKMVEKSKSSLNRQKERIQDFFDSSD